MALRVSVALCTHNGEQYLEEQLRSILGQSTPPHEVVVSDDASGDRTVDLVRAIWAQATPGVPQLVLLHNDVALGVTRNFEKAVAACTGDVIALSDQDDVWRADRLEIMVAEFEAQPQLMLLHTDARMVDADGAPLGYSLFEALDLTDGELQLERDGRGFEALQRRNLVTGATTMVRATVLGHALPFPAEWVHDEWLAAIAAAVGTVAVRREQLIDYRQHGSNQIGARKLGLRGKIGRILEPRYDRYVTLSRRAQVLAERLDALGPVVPESIRIASHEKVSHLELRRALSERRLARLLPVIREAASGRYSLYGRGTGDVLRDILQPATGD